MKVKVVFAIQALMLSWMGISVAQQPASTEASEARQRVNRRFEQEAPKIGESLPDLEVRDSQGKPFHIRSLRGSYTVLVFGCLT